MIKEIAIGQLTEYDGPSSKNIYKLIWVRDIRRIDEEGCGSKKKQNIDEFIFYEIVHMYVWHDKAYTL